MTRISKFTLLLTTVLALGGAPEQASAQCDPNAAFCADAQGLRGGRATIQVSRRPRTVVVRPAPAPPTYVVQPPPQHVVVVAPPPAPPQRVVVIQPAPPPPQRVVVVQQPPPPPQQVIVVQPQPQQQVVVQQQRPRWTMADANRRRIGLHAELSGIASQQISIAGVSAGLRLRPIPFLGIDLTLGLYGGEDFVGNRRIEVPARVNARFFVNPQHRLQFYGLIGAGISFAMAENPNSLARRNFTHVGGELGAGLEYRLNPHIAVNFDIRGFLRQRVDSDPRPEYVEVDEFDNILRTTDTSAGATLNLGGTIYF